MKTMILALLFKIICVSIIVYGSIRGDIHIVSMGNIGWMISLPAFYLAYKRLKRLERGRL